MLRENRPEKILYRAEELKVVSKIHPSLRIYEDLVVRFEEARQLGLINSLLFNVYLALLIYPLTKEELESFLSYLRFNRSTARALKETIELKNLLPELGRKGVMKSEIYFLLEQYSQTAIIANSIATSSVVIKQNIDVYLTSLRNIRPRLNGDDLKRMGILQGPEIKKILRTLHAARLDGKIRTKQGEVRLVYSYSNKRQE